MATHWPPRLALPGEAPPAATKLLAAIDEPFGWRRVLWGWRRLRHDREGQRVSGSEVLMYGCCIETVLRARAARLYGLYGTLYGNALYGGGYGRHTTDTSDLPCPAPTV